MTESQKHQLDLSGIKHPNAITPQAQAYIEEIIRQRSLTENELTFLSLSAKRTADGGLETTFIVTNGTTDDMVIKQLPLNFYDASGDLVAQGTFQLADFTVKRNTSKPLTLVFPKMGVLRDEMDLSSSSIEMAQTESER